MLLYNYHITKVHEIIIIVIIIIIITIIMMIRNVIRYLYVSAM